MSFTRRVKLFLNWKLFISFICVHLRSSAVKSTAVFKLNDAIFSGLSQRHLLSKLPQTNHEYPLPKKNRNTARRALALIVLTPAALLAQPAANQASVRKIYADYHNTRLTRAHDGATGHWSYSATAAKTAHIDGFLVEWGFTTHRSELVRRALTDLARRYDFEIGLNLCDRWLFQQLPWQRPELADRKALFAEFFRNYHYLVTEVFNNPVTVRFNKRPVMFLFGNGLTPPEFEQLRTSKTARSIPGEHPVVLLNSMKGAPWFDS